MAAGVRNISDAAGNVTVQHDPSFNRSIRMHSNTSWTVPPGVFFIEVEACGGGGGAQVSTGTNPGVGGSDTTVSIAGQTLTGPRARSCPIMRESDTVSGRTGNGTPNTGQGVGIASVARTGTGGSTRNQNGNAYPTLYGVQVTPGDSASITIGAGGTQGSFTGGSGYVIIRWEV